MAKTLYRLRRLLRKAQLLFLLLSVVYIMGGCILLLQRTPSIPISASPDARNSHHHQQQRPLIPSEGSPARAHHRWLLQGGSGSRGPSDADVSDRSGSNAHAGKQQQALGRVMVRNLNRDRRVLRRHMFQSGGQVTQSKPSPLSSPSHASGRHKGSYMGCFVDDAQTHALGGTVLYDFRKMTPALCQDTCSESGFQYAGLEYGAECHCGNSIAGPEARLEECNLDCKGEKGAPCGGIQRLSVYKVDRKPPGQRKYSSLHYRGCFQKPYDARASLHHIIESYSTLEGCIEGCTEREYPLVAIRGASVRGRGRGPSCVCMHASDAVTLHNRVAESWCHPGNHTSKVNTSSNPLLEPYQVYHTPALDARCRERTFLSESSAPLVALASFPGAGNTWVRHLIELSTGYYTGSFYFDGALFNGGFKGEKDYWKKGRTICVKTHESGQRDIEMFDAGILILRNPYRSLVAEFNRKCGGHVGYATERHWRSKDWPEFVESHASWWASHALSWLRGGRRLLVVHFEDLQSDILPQLRLITSFLNASISTTVALGDRLPITPDDRLLCAESGSSDGQFKRSGPRKPTFDPYTPAMREMVDRYIRTVDQALRNRNFRGLPQEYVPI